MKYTDEQIKKALEVLHEWERLAYHNDDGTDEDSHELLESLNIVFNLINRQEAEKKALTENSITAKYPNRVLCSKGLILTKSFAEYVELINDISAEAIKEFAERLKEELADKKYKYVTETNYSKTVNSVIDACIASIDNLVKERVGEGE